jgi:PAS domain S-box-containing protein
VTDPANLPLSGDELFRALVEATDDALTYVIDLSRPHGPPIYVSPQVEKILGRTAAEMDDWSSRLLEVVHVDDRDRIVEGGTRAVRRGEMFDEEFRIVLPDGTTKWLRDRAHIVPARDGRAPMWVGFAIDVTARRRRQERARIDAEHHRRLVEQLPGIVFRLANEPPYDRVTYLSPQIQDVFGYPLERWINDHSLWTETIHADDRDAVAAAWRSATATETPFVAEYRFRRSDGEIVWVRESTTPVRLPDGRVEEWQGLLLDVTDAHRAEERRAISDQRWRMLVENAPAIVFTVENNDTGETMYVGPQLETILGYGEETWRTDPDFWIGLLHPEDRSRVLDGWAASVQTGRPFAAEYRMRRANGTYAWVREHTHPAFDADGSVRYWQGLTLDVTATREAEAALELTAARYQALVEGIPAVVYEVGPDDERRTLYVGPQIEELLGYSRAEWLEQPDIWIELLHPDDREFELAAHDLHNETGDPWRRDYRLIADDGRVVWVRDQAVLVRDAGGRAVTWQGVLLDVTAQKEAEEQLRQANDELEFRVRARTSQLEEANELMSLEIGERRRMEKEVRKAEERYRQLVEDLPAVIYTWQPTNAPDGTDASYISPQIEQVVGFTPAVWHGDWDFWRTRLHPHDHDAVVAATEHTARTGEPFQMEYRYLAKDGRVVWVLDRATLLARDDEGRPLIMQGVMLDITARKLAEAKAAAAEERFREVAESAPAITYVFELDHDNARRTTLDYVSPQIAEVLGYPVSRWMDDPAAWLQVIHPDDRDAVIASSRASFASGAPWAIDYRVLAADGEIRWMHSRARCASRDVTGRPSRFVGVLVDVTDRQDASLRVRDDLASASSLLEGMPGVPWTELVDPETGWRRFTYIGPQARTMFGYEPEELIAEPGHFERMLHPDDRDRVLVASRRTDLTGEPWVDEFRVVLRDGSTRWFHGTGRRVSAEGVKPAVWQGVTIDVTDVHAAASPSARSTLGRRRR